MKLPKILRKKHELFLKIALLVLFLRQTSCFLLEFFVISQRKIKKEQVYSKKQVIS